MLISILNDEDMELLLKFKVCFGKYHPVCPNLLKILKVFFVGHSTYILHLKFYI